MACCSICGRSSRTAEMEKLDTDFTFDTPKGEFFVRKNNFVCVPDEDCFETVQSRLSEFPEDIEDTPSLDPPPWKGEFVS